MASFRLNCVVYLAKQQGLFGRALMCRYSSGTKAPKKAPATAAAPVKTSPKATKPPKPTEKVAEKAVSSPKETTSIYKVEEYYTFTEYSFYDLDPNTTKSQLGRTLTCRYVSGDKSGKTPPKSTPTSDKKPKPPTDGSAKPPGSSDTQTYKNTDYFSFNQFDYYDMDAHLTKYRCPVPNKYN